jgi:hypothetical protein
MRHAADWSQLKLNADGVGGVSGAFDQRGREGIIWP